VLFIGNSLTEGNDLPGMVRTLASAAGLDWDVQAQLLSGAGLEDHWTRGAAQQRIQSGRWDAVVLQQALPRCRIAGPTCGSGPGSSTC
jgi:hypothetical protein